MFPTLKAHYYWPGPVAGSCDVSTSKICNYNSHDDKLVGSDDMQIILMNFQSAQNPPVLQTNKKTFLIDFSIAHIFNLCFGLLWCFSVDPETSLKRVENWKNLISFPRHVLCCCLESRYSRRIKSMKIENKYQTFNRLSRRRE